MTDKHLPTTDEISGSDPNFTAGLDSAAYVRHLRGGTLEALGQLRAVLKRLNDAQAAIEATGEQADYIGPHEEADAALLAYIDDPEVTRLFEALGKYYA